MPDHVFVCYARKNKDFVLKLATTLKERNMPIWLDQWNIPPSEDWDQAIDKAIDDCAYFLIILSPESINSEEVRGELRTALDANKPIVPVLYQPCRIPRRLRLIHYVDFSPKGLGEAAALKQFLSRLSGEPETTLPQPRSKLGRLWSHIAIGRIWPLLLTPLFVLLLVLIVRPRLYLFMVDGYGFQAVIQNGTPVALRWRASLFTSNLAIDPPIEGLEQPLPRQGTAVAFPKSDETYYLRGGNLLSDLVPLFTPPEKAVRVVVTPIPPSVTFRANPNQVFSGEEIVLAWVVDNADKIEIFRQLDDNGLFEFLGDFSDLPVGSLTITPGANQDMIFVLLASNAYVPTATPYRAEVRIIPTPTPTPQTPVPRIDTPTPEPTPTSLPQSITASDGATMVLVPAGPFEMGSNQGQSNQQPAHEILLASFYIDQYEVTNAQYLEFLQTHGNQVEGDYPWIDTEYGYSRVSQVGEQWQVAAGYADHPVTGVSWYGARAYCDWREARLPTEAE